MNDSPELLTVEDVAGMLGLSARTIWRMVERGQLPEPLRWSRKLVRWKRDDLEAWLAGQRPAQALHAS